MRVIDKVVTVVGYQYDGTGLASFQSGLGTAKARLNSFSQHTFKAGAALTAGMVGTVKSFAGYESEMAKIEGLVGISSQQLDAWQERIKAISHETGQAPKELAESLFFVTSAGLRGEDAMSTLRHSARAAAAGLGEQATIADLLTSAMNAYGPSVLSAEDAVNHLTEAVRLGKLEPATLADAMGRVMPIASAMGVKFHEATGLIAAMSKTGTTAAEGVTQLNAVMMGLLKPQEKAKKALAEVGIDFQELRDMAGGPGGLWSVLIKVRDAFEQNNQSLVKVFPNIRAVRGIFDLLGPQLESNKALLDEMADSTGVADEAFDAMAGTVGFKWRQTVADFKIQLIEMGQALAPTAKRLMDFAQNAINWFSNLGEGWKRAITTALALGPAILGIGIAAKVAAIGIGAFSGVLKALVVVKGLFASAAVGTKLGLLGIAAGTKLAAAGTAVLGVAMAALPIIGWISALVALGVLIYKFRDQIAGALTAAWNWLRDIVPRFFSAGVDVVKAIGRGIWEVYTWPYRMLWRAIQRVWDWLSNIDWSELGKRLIGTFVSGIKNFPIVKQVAGVLDKVRNLLPFSDAKEGPLKHLTESGRRFVSTFAEGVQQASPGLVRTVAGALPYSAPLPVGPLPSRNVSTSRSMSFSVGDIIVHAPPGADPNEIAESTVSRLDEQFRGLVEEFDSNERA